MFEFKLGTRLGLAAAARCSSQSEHERGDGVRAEVLRVFPAGTITGFDR